MNEHPQHLHESALRFYARHQGEHFSHDRKRLIERCADFIGDAYNLAALTAENIALRAWGEVESRSQRCYINLDLSTAHAVFVVDPSTGHRRVFTVADLVEMIPQRA